MLRPVLQPDGSFRIPAEKLLALRDFVQRYHVVEELSLFLF